MEPRSPHGRNGNPERPPTRFCLPLLRALPSWSAPCALFAGGFDWFAHGQALRGRVGAGCAHRVGGEASEAAPPGLSPTGLRPAWLPDESGWDADPGQSRVKFLFSGAAPQNETFTWLWCQSFTEKEVIPGRGPRAPPAPSGADPSWHANVGVPMLTEAVPGGNVKGAVGPGAGGGGLDGHGPWGPVARRDTQIRGCPHHTGPQRRGQGRAPPLQAPWPLWRGPALGMGRPEVLGKPQGGCWPGLAPVHGAKGWAPIHLLTPGCG